ncbi:MAG: glycoside hydrolase family 15 protein, partial [Xanthobacteraceae bacterium]
KELDANLLLLPCIGFLPVSDPRIENTIAAVERELINDGFVMRYSTEKVADSLPPGEGAFLACSFWLVDVYTLQGRYDEAEQMFQRLVGLRNDVGLLSEEYDPRTKRLVGNFPQAFSHLALVNSAYNLTRARKPVQQRAQDEHAPPEQAAVAAD